MSLAKVANDPVSLGGPALSRRLATREENSARKMALARGILAFLPLQRLLDLYWPGPAFERIAALRLQSFNRLTEAEAQKALALPELQKFPAELRYVGVCTYQGELSDMAWFFLPTRWLRQRAFRLRDISAMHYFTLLEKYGSSSQEGQEIFESEEPAAWATLLTRYVQAPSEPQRFRWTAGLRRFFEARLPSVLTNAVDPAVKTAVFLRRRLVSGERVYMQRVWHLQALVSETEDGYIPNLSAAMPATTPSLYQLLEDADSINLIPDTIGPDGPELQTALSHLRPNVARYLLARTSGNISPPALDQWLFITETEVRAAARILEVLPEQPSLDFYRDQLRVLLGQKIQQPDRHYELMIRVAHPQLPQLPPLTPEQALGLLNDELHSTVFYRPELWLEVLPEKVLDQEAFLRVLYVRCNFLAARLRISSIENVDEIQDPFELEDVVEGGDNVFTKRRFQLFQLTGRPLPPADQITLPTLEDVAWARQLYPGEDFAETEKEIRARIQRWQEIYRQVSD